MPVDSEISSGLSAVTPAQWAALAEGRFFFGHQSVGRNIVDGMVDLLAEHREIPLMIAESRNFGARPAFYHATVGRNQFPQEKLDEFAAIVDRSLGGERGIAMLKFCPADVRPDSDPQALFDAYRQQTDVLKANHPMLTVVHLTMPLARSESWRGVVKKRLRGQMLERDRNVVRNRYNTLIRETYSGREPVFDIAQLESTLPDGSRLFLMAGTDTVYTMSSLYASDAAHLNEVGRRMVAEQLLIFLARLAGGRAAG